MEVKKAQQERLAEWARRKNRLHYLSALDTIRHIVEMRSDLRYRERMLNEGIVRAIEFASVPVANADSLIVALQKKDEANAGKFAGLLARDYRNFANKNYSAAVDRRVAKAMICLLYTSRCV